MNPEWIIALGTVGAAVGVVFYAGRLDQIVRDLVRRVTVLEERDRQLRLEGVGRV